MLKKGEEKRQEKERKGFLRPLLLQTEAKQFVKTRQHEGEEEEEEEEETRRSQERRKEKEKKKEDISRSLALAQ